MMRWVSIFLLFLLVSCQPDATPFPVNIPATATDSPSTQQAASNEPSSIRYALAANTVGAVADYELIADSAQVEQLVDPVNAADLGSRYDIVAGYGDFPDGTRSPVTPHVSLLLNPLSPPLDNAALADVLRRAIDTQMIVSALAISGVSADAGTSADFAALRTELANIGLPDGFVVNIVSAYAPGTEAVRATLLAAGIDSRWGVIAPDSVETAFSSGRAQAALVTWTDNRAMWETLAGESNIIDLYSVPISYLAADGLTITFTPNGFPIATR